MTTTPMPWPKRRQPIWVGARNGGDLLQAEENARYERARAEAALSRLRIAVEALRWYQFEYGPAADALSLCDLPANEGDGGAG